MSDVDKKAEILFTAVEVAALLSENQADIKTPTAEQIEIIEASCETQQLVIAGAGSGKTETLSQRVVWLVANGKVRPREILGLTFTNKSAGELLERVQIRIENFLRIATERASELNQKQQEKIYDLTQQLRDGTDMPEIFTYNAFAGSLVAEFGGISDVPAGLSIISHTQARVIAKQVVAETSPQAFLEINPSSAKELAKNLVFLENQMTDNNVSVQSLQKELEKYCSPHFAGDKAPTSSYKDIIPNFEYKLKMLPLVSVYRELKKDLGVIEFSDQVALANKIFAKSARAINLIRDRYKIVLLDEVQDTSVGQTRLLSKLFAGMCVMGVGDPHQAIYAWRGASADALSKFLEAFKAEHQQPGRVYNLSVSWRNSKSVLKVANVVADPLKFSLKNIEVKTLEARPHAPAGEVIHCAYETVKEEQEWVAQQIKRIRDAAKHNHEPLPEIAVIMRTRAQMSKYERALKKAGVPCVIVGVGGLLEAPEIVDLVSVMKVIEDPEAGAELIRLLTGPKYRISLADVRALGYFARKLIHAPVRTVDDEYFNSDVISDEPVLHHDRIITNVMALDYLSMRMKQAKKSNLFSDEGLKRLQRASKDINRLREISRGSVLELIDSCVRYLGIDIELAAHPKYRSSVTGAKIFDTRSNIDAFSAAVAKHMQFNRDADLSEILEWLDIVASTDEEAAIAEIKPSRETVQIITGHGAKGLEWDVVFLPNLVASSNRGGKSTSGIGKSDLPHKLRQDSDSLPILDFSNANNFAAANKLIAAYKKDCKTLTELDERRVMYVMMTRAKHSLYLSNSSWQLLNKNMSKPNEYLGELAAADLISKNFLEQSDSANQHANPLKQKTGERADVEWPLNPLGSRAKQTLAAAATVTAALDQLETDDAAKIPELSSIQALLLAEEQGARNVFKAKKRINASEYHEIVNDPQAYITQQLRPMPTKPYAAARLGNRFHDWIERLYQTDKGREFALSGLEDLETIHDEKEAKSAEKFKALQENFLKSKWARKMALHTELEIIMPFADTVINCKLDAVFEWKQPDGRVVYEIVDWKTGRAPIDVKDLESKFLQLQLYRHAYARYAEIDPELIDASIFYVAENKTYTLKDLRQTQILGLEELSHAYLDAIRG